MQNEGGRALRQVNTARRPGELTFVVTSETIASGKIRLMTAVNTTPAQTRRSQNTGPNPAAPEAPPPPRMKAVLATKLFPWMTAVAVVSLLGNAVMYFRFTTLRSLVTVGNKTITKREYLAVLDDAAGKPVLNKMVYDELVRQAAAKAEVTPTAQDIEQRLAAVRTRDPKLAGSVPDYKLRDAVTSNLALENLRIQNVQVTGAEIVRYYQAHPLLFHQQQITTMAMVVTASNTDAQTVSHLLEQNVDPTILAKQPEFHVVGMHGYTVDLQAPAHKSLVQTILSMKPRTVRTFRFDTQFLTVRVFRNEQARTAPLAEVRNQVSRMAKLEKAPSVKSEIVGLYHTNRPTFDIGKYEKFFDDLDQK